MSIGRAGWSVCRWQKDEKNPPAEEPTLSNGPPGHGRWPVHPCQSAVVTLKVSNGAQLKRYPVKPSLGKCGFPVININPNAVVCTQVNWDNLGIHNMFEIKLISQNYTLLSFKTIRLDNWIASELMNAWKYSAPFSGHRLKFIIIDSSSSFTSFYLSEMTKHTWTFSNFWGENSDVELCGKKSIKCTVKTQTQSSARILMQAVFYLHL